MIARILTTTLCLAALAATPAPARERQVELKVGQQQVFEVPGIEKVSVSGGSAGRIVDVRPLDSERLLVVGLRPGHTSLPVFLSGRRSETWHIRVVDDAAERFRAGCAALLGDEDCAGLSAVEAGGKLVLRGRVADLQTYHRLRKIQRAFPDVVAMVDIEPALLDGLVRAINQQFAASDLAHARVSRVGTRLFLEGTVSDERERRKAQAIVEALWAATLGAD